MGLWASSFDPRITIYALALDSEILNTAQFNFHTAVTIALVSLCITNGLYKWTTFEIAALKFVIVGVFFYMTLFWLPVVGLRGLELFTSLLPVVGAAGYKSSKSLTMRAIILIMFVALFLNSVVRNGLMLDLVLPGQPQESLLNDR